MYTKAGKEAGNVPSSPPLPTLCREFVNTQSVVDLALDITVVEFRFAILFGSPHIEANLGITRVSIQQNCAHKQDTAIRSRAIHPSALYRE